MNESNISNAILIVACLYFLTQVSNFWAKLGIILILLFAIVTWKIWKNPSEDGKRLIEARINETDSRTRLNNSNAAMTTANAFVLRDQVKWNQKNR
jgi:Ca2+/Na+ antiporter